jgi:hypothetical protein
VPVWFGTSEERSMHLHRVLALAVLACGQAVSLAQVPRYTPGPSPALQVNTPPTPMFRGNPSGVAPSLQVFSPPTPLLLGNAASAAVPVNTPPIAISRGSAVGQTAGLDYQPTGPFHQLQRPYELQLPYGRFRWFEDPNVQWQLNLTDQQRQTLRDDLEWSWQQRREIARLAATDSAGAEQLYRTYHEEYRQRLNQLLTPAQKRAWHEMTGEPLVFQPPFMSTTTGPR